MRIIAGTARGRRLMAPPGNATRPTGDRVREALFSMLTSRGALAKARVLDLFAGTGALAFEALSRGASHAALVEAFGPCCDILRQNAENLGFAANYTLHQLRVEKALPWLQQQGHSFQLIFADPPYGVDMSTLEFDTFIPMLLERGGWFALEHQRQTVVKDRLAALEQAAQRTYGDTTLSLFTKADS